MGQKFNAGICAPSRPSSSKNYCTSKLLLRWIAQRHCDHKMEQPFGARSQCRSNLSSWWEGSVRCWNLLHSDRMGKDKRRSPDDRPTEVCQDSDCQSRDMSKSIPEQSTRSSLPSSWLFHLRWRRTRTRFVLGRWWLSSHLSQTWWIIRSCGTRELGLGMWSDKCSGCLHQRSPLSEMD